MANTDTSTSSRHLKRLYRNRGDAEATKDLGPDVQYVIIETINGGHRIEADMALIFPEGHFPPPCMGLAATAFGLNTVLGNAVAGKDKDDPRAVADLIRARWDSIRDGEWSEGRQGPQLKDALAAWAMDAVNRGKTVTPDSIAKMRAKIVSGEATVKGLLDNPNIQVCYQQVLLRKQQERLQEAEAKLATPSASQVVFDPE